jgi:thiamine pyrophosphate-dependent acetolactate synthase large subunit-like protein
MAGPNLADTVIDYLLAQNVRYIFGVLAHTLFPLGDAIAKRPELRFINAQHEGGAGNMALGYARVTKQPAVCLVSRRRRGDQLSSRPSLKRTKKRCRYSSYHQTIGTASFAKGHWASWHGMEHVRLFQPITKQSARLGRIEELGSVLDSLFRQTTRGRQGPVFFCIPEDLQETHLPEPITFAPSANPAAPAMDARTVNSAVDLLLGASTPVLLAGTGVDWAEAQDEVKELAELLSLPVCQQLYRQRRFPGESSPRSRLPWQRRPHVCATIFSGSRLGTRRRHQFQRRDYPRLRP